MGTRARAHFHLKSRLKMRRATLLLPLLSLHGILWGDLYIYLFSKKKNLWTIILVDVQKL